MRAKTAETCAMNARESGGLNASQRKREGDIKVEMEGGRLFNCNCGMWFGLEGHQTKSPRRYYADEWESPNSFL